MLPPTSFSKLNYRLSHTQWRFYKSHFRGFLERILQNFLQQRICHQRCCYPIAWDYPMESLLSRYESLLFPSQQFPLPLHLHAQWRSGTRSAQLCHTAALWASAWFSGVFARQRQVGLVIAQPCMRLFGVWRFVWHRWGCRLTSRRLQFPLLCIVTV